MAMTCPKDRKVTYATYTLVDEAEFHNIELNRLWKIMENPSLGKFII